MATVYNFLGYRLLEANYYSLEGNNTTITIRINGKLEDSIYVIEVIVETDFSSRQNSTFKFEAAFKVNDMEWYEKLSDSERKMVFSSIVFPFVREKIFSISSDIKPGLLIPMLDLKNIDASKEIKLTRRINKENKEMQN